MTTREQAQSHLPPAEQKGHLHVTDLAVRHGPHRVDGDPRVVAVAWANWRLRPAGHAHAQAQMWPQHLHHMQVIYQHARAAASRPAASGWSAAADVSSSPPGRDAQLGSQSTSTQQTSQMQSPTTNAQVQDSATNKYAHLSYASRHSCQNAGQSTASQLVSSSSQDPSSTSQQCQKQQSLLVRDPATQSNQQASSSSTRQQCLQQQSLLNRQQLQICFRTRPRRSSQSKRRRPNRMHNRSPPVSNISSRFKRHRPRRSYNSGSRRPRISSISNRYPPASS